MRVTFIGTGEAYSADRANVSILVQDQNFNFLLDCGFSVPRALWSFNSDPNFIDAIWVSHPHGDHAAGIPLVCMRLRQEKRTKPLTIIGPEGIENYVKQLFELVYRGFFPKSTFPINFVEAAHGNSIGLGPLNLSFAAGSHLTAETEVPTRAIRIDSAGKSICYSGDTIYSKSIADLAKGCDLLVHETYMPASSEYHAAMKAHCSPLEAGRVAAQAGAKKLALVHIHRNWIAKQDELKKEAATEFGGEILIPDDGHVFEL